MFNSEFRLKCVQYSGIYLRFSYEVIDLKKTWRVDGQNWMIVCWKCLMIFSSISALSCRRWVKTKLREIIFQHSPPPPPRKTRSPSSWWQLTKKIKCFLVFESPSTVWRLNVDFNCPGNGKTKVPPKKSSARTKQRFFAALIPWHFKFKVSWTIVNIFTQVSVRTDRTVALHWWLTSIDKQLIFLAHKVAELLKSPTVDQGIIFELGLIHRMLTHWVNQQVFRETIVASKILRFLRQVFFLISVT